MKKQISEYPEYNQTGITAKQTAATKSVTSPAPSDLNKSSPSPTTTGKSPTPTKKPAAVKARELKVDQQFPDKEGNLVKVISPFNTGRNKEAIVVQDEKTKEYFTMSPDDQVNLGQVEESVLDRKANLARKLARKGNKLKQLIRAARFGNTYDDPLFEINFNSKEVAQSALNSGIKCGFEAETVWPNLGEGSSDDDDTSWLDDLYWNRVSDLIYDQEGSSALERVEEAYREWLQESDYFYEVESEVISDLVNDRKEDEAYLNDFIIANSSLEDEIEEYKAEKLADLESAADGGDESAQAEFEEYSDWDDDAWAREYIELNKQDEYIEWLEEQIRDTGEHWDDVWERAIEQYDMNDWVSAEYGSSWYSLLIDQDIYLNNEDAESGGVDEVASMLEGWASNNSRSSDVRAGYYHSGKGVDNTYWRVEDDVSIEGSGAKAEIISPVYNSPAEMLKEMKSLFEYMSNNDVETNSSTGLHVTMSMPEAGTAETNQLKMALLLGDKYVAKQYGREHNSYTRSQIERIKEYVADLQNNIKNEKSLAALEELVSGGISAGKFSSIHFKDAENDAGNKLIEFRVAGGEDYHTMMDTVIKTVIRYGAVMQAGHDPAAFRKDYAKALVKLVTTTGDIDQTIQQKAQQLVDPESIDSNVLSAFQTIAGKKHYTDAIEALSDAYVKLADAQKMRDANPQKELQFEDDENADWRRQMKYAQNYFVRAFAMLASDLASSVNRAQPKAAQISALRRATAQFGLTFAELWERLQQSEFYKNFPGDVHSKSEKFASAVNSLLKKQEAKGLEPKFTVKFNPATQRMFMPGPIVGAAYRDSGNNIFGDDGKATGNMPQTLGPEHFKPMDDSEYHTIREIRYYYENKLEGIESDMEVINATKRRQKELPDQASEFQTIIDDRMERVKKNQAEAAEYKKEIDQIIKKYGFVPKTVRHGSDPMGEDWQVVTTDIVAWISREYNIKFTANENKMNTFDRFDNLPLQEQLRVISKVDKRKLDEAWSKKYKKSIDCNNPKGFSQKAHCAGKKKANEDRTVKLSAKEISNVKLGSGEYLYLVTYKDGSTKKIIAKTPLGVRRQLKDPDGKYKNPSEPTKAELGIKRIQQVSMPNRRPDVSWTKSHRKKTSVKAPRRVASKGRNQDKYGPVAYDADKAAMRKKIADLEFERELRALESIEAEQDMAALLTAYGTPKKKKSRKVKEGAVPETNIYNEYKQIMSKPLLGSDIKAQMYAYQIIPDPAMIKEFRFQIAQGGKETDLRAVFKSFAQQKLHPVQKKRLGLSEAILMEKGLNLGDIGKRDNFAVFKRKVASSNPFATVDGAEVVISPTFARKISTVDDLKQYTQNRQVMLPLKNDPGYVVPLSYLLKTAEFGGTAKKETGVANRGELAEGVLGAATFARIAKRPGKPITYDEVLRIIKSLPKTETGGTISKNVKSGGVTDKITLTVKLGANTYADLIDTDKLTGDAQMNSYIKSTVQFVNDYTRLYANFFEQNGRPDEVEIVSDGVSENTDRKTDVYMIYVDEEGNRQLKHFDISLKAGTVKQFGQVGYGRGSSPIETRFAKVMELFTQFGIDQNSFKFKPNQFKDDDGVALIKDLYKQAVGLINKKLGSDEAEYNYLDQITQGITYFATSNDPTVKLLQLDKGRYYVLDFKKLRPKLEGIDLEAQYAETSAGDPIVRIHDKNNPTTSGRLLQIRTKKDSNNYIRQILEKEPLLKKLVSVRSVTDIER